MSVAGIVMDAPRFEEYGSFDGQIGIQIRFLVLDVIASAMWQIENANVAQFVSVSPSR